MEAQKLNQTFIPKQILKKTSINNHNSILATHEFEKTAGNSYIQFDPIQVKFNGYELGKTATSVVKIINKSPIPQRIHILGPSQPGFAVKVNKKGPIASGMSENMLITFASDVYKYQYDVVKINTQTGNFIVPIYAYPSIPRLDQVFPKIIDFGQVPINQSNSFMYPIVNPIPIDFNYEFAYVQESSAFIITPIKGIIASNATQNVEVTFIPSQKKTFTAQVVFKINQFDFQPIKIKILGTGQQKKDRLSSTRKIKSSKLNPIIQKAETKKIDQNKKLDIGELDLKDIDSNTLNQKRSFIRSRTSYPKLLKKASVLNNVSVGFDKLETSIKKQGQKEYNSQFSKILQLDKQKQIKFIQYLGNVQMTYQERQFQEKLIIQTKKARLQNFKQLCLGRHENQLRIDAQIELNKIPVQKVTWDITKNNDLKIRKQKLHYFMKAGSKVIIRYRLAKRLNKIRQFLKDCNNKEEVQKKIQEDYAKSKDLAKQGKTKTNEKLSFSLDKLVASSFKLQFKDESETVNKPFKAEGSAKFDDDKILQQIRPHQTQILGYGNLSFPSDYIYMPKQAPKIRASAQQQYPLKTSALPDYQIIKPSNVIYNFPLKVPSHQFIFNNFELCRYKSLNALDEKDPENILDSYVQNIEDQFEGWSKGDMALLRTKFHSNPGCQFAGISMYNYPEYDIGFLPQIGSHLPKQIGNTQITKDDTLDEGDSDQEKIAASDIDKPQNILIKIEQTNAKIKQRRQKKQMTSFEANQIQKMNRNLQKIKNKHLAKAVDKISEYNKWALSNQNKLLI